MCKSAEERRLFDIKLEKRLPTIFSAIKVKGKRSFSLKKHPVVSRMNYLLIQM